MARKKVKKVFSRRAQTGWAAAPTTSFWDFKNYGRMEIDKKEISKSVKDYIRENYKKDKKELLQAPEWVFTYYYVGATVEWMKLEKPFPVKWKAQDCIDRFIKEVQVLAKQVITEKKEEPKVVVQKKSIADIVKERTSDFIAEVEEVLDTWSNGVWLDVDNYSPYLELQKIDAPYNIAKGVYDYYLPMKKEAEELVNKKTKDLVEAYSHLSTKRQNQYLKLLTVIVDDAEKYMLSKKAVRKIRKPTVKSADKQIKDLKFLKDSDEFKLASINPMSIIGSMRLYTFNTKNRVLTEYICMSPKGFEVKGSTLQGVDLEDSRETKLRKPDEFLSVVLKGTPAKVNTEWKKLTTKTNTPNPRINKDTIILRALDK